MDLTELKINEFLELLASKSPTPGGGAAAALAASTGVALVEMVVAHTLGKKGYEQFEPLMEQTGAQAKALREIFNSAVNKDAEAFELVISAYKMKKDTSEEKKLRDEAIEDALKQAADAPFNLMEHILRAVVLCEGAVGKSNKNVASDLSVSAIMLRAAAQAAAVNVEINLSSINDVSFVSEYREKSFRLLSETEKMTQKILEAD